MMDIVFIISAVAFCLLIASVFVAQRHGRNQLTRIFGVILIALALPFALYLIQSIQKEKGFWVYLGLSLVLIYLLAELLLDYIFGVDFRSKWITHIPYILLEYAAFFGLIHTAVSINRTAGWIVGVSFWIALACLIYYYSGIRKKGNQGS